MGFGESLLAVPLLSLFLPLEVAVPLSVMVSVLIALMIVLQDHTKIHFQSAKWLVIYAVPGIPLGLLVLIYANEVYMKILLGVLIILYSVYALQKAKIKVPKLQSGKSALILSGFLSGILGGAYGLNGPPLVIYGHLKQWNPKQFRATLQAYFLPAGILGIIGYLYKGLITAEVNYYFLLSLIVVIPAVFIGRYLNQKIKDNSFFKYAYMGLIGIGMIMIFNVVG